MRRYGPPPLSSTTQTLQKKKKVYTISSNNSVMHQIISITRFPRACVLVRDRSNLFQLHIPFCFLQDITRNLMVQC